MKIKHHDWLLYGMLSCLAAHEDDSLDALMEAEAMEAHRSGDGNGPYKKFCMGDDLMHRQLHQEKPMATISRQIREAIITRALRDHNKDDKATFKQYLAAFGDKVYEHYFGEDEPKVLALSNSVWYEMAEDIHIECDGFAYNRVDKADGMLPLSRPRPMPPYGSNRSADIAIESSSPLWDEAQALVKMHRNLYEADRALTKEIEALLAKCRTVKQLTEVWPEGMRYLHDSDSTKQPPPEVVEVNMVKRVNEKLGLG